ncbi:hypothetical protein EDC15_1058 [Acetobacter aceti NBRC 14818]|jgi:hypothetical protein|nr:hypothetical protein EDC15_1058 [Acetobacter aceti NBRC 14818]
MAFVSFEPGNGRLKRFQGGLLPGWAPFRGHLESVRCWRRQ